MLHTFFFPCLGGRKLVTAERERPSAPRFQERQRFPRSGKMHSKCRSSFRVHRSGNSGDYGLNNSWKLPALKIQTTRSQKNKDSDNTRTEFMKKQSCFKFFFSFQPGSVTLCGKFWMTANDKHLLLWWDAFVIFSSSVALDADKPEH